MNINRPLRPRQLRIQNLFCFLEGGGLQGSSQEGVNLWKIFRNYE